MRTLEEHYRAHHKCTHETFRRRFFYQCLNRRVLPVAWLLGGARGSYFRSDDELVTGAARAQTLAQVDAECAEFFHHSENRGWVHRRLSFRISTRRVRRFARKYFPATAQLEPVQAG